MVPRAAARPALVGHARRAGRAAVLRRVAALSRRRPAPDRRGLPRRAAGHGPQRDAGADRRAGPAGHRGGRGEPAGDRRPGRRDTVRTSCCASAARSPSPPPASTRRAAENRGQWDRRLEALVIDNLVSGSVVSDSLPSQLAALGWQDAGPIAQPRRGGAGRPDRGRARGGAHPRAARGVDAMAGDARRPAHRGRRRRHGRAGRGRATCSPPSATGRSSIGPSRPGCRTPPASPAPR